MSKRVYAIDERIVGAYMANNFMAESGIVDERADSFVVQNGKRVQSLSKAAVEKWALDHGFVEGRGFDAMSEQDKNVFLANRDRNTMNVRERKSKEFGMKDENLEKFHNQKKETRQTRGRNAAADNVDAGGIGPVEGVHYKPYKGSNK